MGVHHVPEHPSTISPVWTDRVRGRLCPRMFHGAREARARERRLRLIPCRDRASRSRHVDWTPPRWSCKPHAPLTAPGGRPRRCAQASRPGSEAPRPTRSVRPDQQALSERSRRRDSGPGLGLAKQDGVHWLGALPDQPLYLQPRSGEAVALPMVRPTGHRGDCRLPVKSCRDLWMVSWGRICCAEGR